MYTPMVSCFLALLVMVPVESFRLSSEHVRASSNSEEVIKTIEGVTVYNYQLAFEKVKKSSMKKKIFGVPVKAQSANWILLVKPGVSNSRLQAICNHPMVTCDNELMGHSAGVPFVKVRATEEALKDLLKSATQEIEFVEPNLQRHVIPLVPNEEDDDVAIKAVARAGSWGLERIGVPHPTRTGKGVHVYVLDTGVRTTHRDFEGRAIPTLDIGADRFGRSYARKCSPSDRSCAYDRQGHGTHTAGTVASKTYGVAKEATVHAVKILGDDGTGNNQWTLAAMDWITRNAEKPAVMSMSLGGKGRSRMEEQAVAKAMQAGITVVVAAGNEQDDACKYTPAFVQQAITVGATSSGDVRASYSNYGSCVQIYAPGTNIRSLGHRHDGETAEHSGTSMACPHVAGSAALLLGEDASQTPTQIYRSLMASSTRNVIRGLSRSCPNNLLSVSTDAVATPTPSPPSSGDGNRRKACPSFAKYPYVDSEGDCHCRDDASCWSGGSKGCQFSRTREGYASATYFSPDCRDCTCRSKSFVDSARLQCNQYAVSRTPDAEGDCKCSYGTYCSTNGRYLNCPYSGGVGGRTGQYFSYTCKDCKCYRAR